MAFAKVSKPQPPLDVWESDTAPGITARLQGEDVLLEYLTPEGLRSFTRVPSALSPLIRDALAAVEADLATP